MDMMKQLEEGDEFVTVFNNAVLVIGVEDYTLKTKFIGGKSGIPTRWINQIARKEWIQMLCDNFESKFSKHST